MEKVEATLAEPNKLNIARSLDARSPLKTDKKMDGNEAGDELILVKILRNLKHDFYHLSQPRDGGARGYREPQEPQTRVSQFELGAKIFINLKFKRYYKDNINPIIHGIFSK